MGRFVRFRLKSPAPLPAGISPEALDPQYCSSFHQKKPRSVMPVPDAVPVARAVLPVMLLTELIVTPAVGAAVVSSTARKAGPFNPVLAPDMVLCPFFQDVSEILLINSRAVELSEPGFSEFYDYRD